MPRDRAPSLVQIVPGSIEPGSAAALLLGYDTDVFGPARVTRAFLPLMRRSAAPRIVMVSSGMGSITITGDPGRLESSLVSPAYPSSKTALT